MSTFKKGLDRLIKDHYDAKELGLLLIGLVAIGFALLLYRKTNINATIYLVLPALIFGLVVNLVWPKKPSEHYGYKRVSVFILGMCAHTILWGGIYAAGLLSINTFATQRGHQYTEKLSIISKGSMIGASRKDRDKRQAIYTIMLDGQAKDFIFDHETYQKLDSFNYLLVQYRSGALGFGLMEGVLPVR
jgi:hypothetical protein